MSPDGSNPRAITGPKYSQWEPAWLSDSSKLVVTTGRSCDPDLLLITSTGSEERYVAASKRSEGSATCSPDDLWVAYNVVDDSEGLDAEKMRIHIWKRRLDDITIPAVQLTSGQYWDTDPKYSPDGSKILFCSDRDDRSSGIWVMNADGTGMAQIPVQAVSATDPAWSPDGTKIAFVRDTPEGSSGVVLSDIWLVNPDGTGLTQVTHTVSSPTFDPEGGTYTESQTVTITCPTPGVTIRYTTDGTDPTENSPIYTEPVAVEESLTLKAKAWKTDWFPSHVASVEYVIE